MHNDNSYKHIYGVTIMGSLLVRAIANLFLANFEEHIFRNLNENAKSSIFEM